MKITLIAAIAQNRVLGNGGAIPWHIPEDFAFFKAYTTGKPIIMGRKTWESLPRKPLPGRRNIVISRQSGYRAEGAEVFADFQAAFFARLLHGLLKLHILRPLQNLRFERSSKQ